MALTIICIAAAIIVSVGIYTLSSVKEDRKKLILHDLGLVHSLTSGLKSPFYKWGWRKVSDDRVWGERIVREAFEKRNIGLTQQDLEYFSKVCAQFAGGKSVDKTAVIGYIEKILGRSSSVSNFATKFIQPILENSLRASPNQAKKFLDRVHIDSSVENAPDRLAVYQLKKMLNQHGMGIICSNAGGLHIKGESNEILMTLTGFDSWVFWLKSCKASIEQCLSQRALSTPSQAKFIKKQILDFYINNEINHMNASRQFIKTMDSLINQESLSINISVIENLERAFYGWHFSESLQFSIQNHESMRSLLSMPELPSRIRKALLEFITPTYESLHALMHRFPRHVIFYGANSHTRLYATQQYLVHLNKINKIISDMLKRKSTFPLMLRIFDSDVEKARNPEPDDFMKHVMPPNRRRNVDEDEEVVKNIGHMPLMIDTQKSMVLFEKDIEPDKAEKIGWIIEIPVEDFTPKEYAQFDLGDYLKYKRINCDKHGEIDQEQESKSAHMQRERFLNSIFETLLGDSSISPLSF